MPAPKSTEALLALGSNLGDRLRNLREGLARLAGTGRIRIVACSSLYASDPVGAAGGEFYNAVIRVRTDADPRTLLDLAKQAEHAAGRTGSGHDARPLDVDILYFGDAVVSDAELAIPHPRRLERPFVRIPLAKVCGSDADPATGRPIATEISVRAHDEEGIRLVAGPEWAES